MRAVAAHADVDVSLIYHYFGNKDDLLAAALTVPERAQPNLVAIPAGTRNPGRAVASAIIDMWEHDPALREHALAMIRTALSHEHAAQRLQAVHSTAVLILVA
jgi:AcrR family transcriptional regulator